MTVSVRRTVEVGRILPCWSLRSYLLASIIGIVLSACFISTSMKRSSGIFLTMPKHITLKLGINALSLGVIFSKLCTIQLVPAADLQRTVVREGPFFLQSRISSLKFSWRILPTDSELRGESSMQSTSTVKGPPL